MFGSFKPVQGDFYVDILDPNVLIFFKFDTVVSWRNPNCENRFVCKRRDIYFRDSALLNLQQDIVGLYASNYERLANQNACT